MKYLFEKIFGNEEVFNKKLFNFNSYKNLNESILKKKFFNKIIIKRIIGKKNYLNKEY